MFSHPMKWAPHLENVQAGDQVPIQGPLLRAISTYAPEVEHRHKCTVSYRNHAIDSPVLTIPEHCIAIKCGSDVHRAEADNMRYVADHTTIPVQKVFGMHEEGGSTFLVLEHVSGTSLQLNWDDMSESDKKYIADQLAGMFKQLSGLEASYIGMVGRRPCNDIIFRGTSAGPFHSEREMNKVIVYRQARGNDVPIPASVDTTLRSLREKGDHRIVFVHGAVSERNILVNEDNQVVAIINWQNSGFYPEYWEFVNALTVISWKSDWCVYVQQFLATYYEEYALWFELQTSAYR